MLIPTGVVLTEIREAKAQGRQPRCPYCGELLEVAQNQYLLKEWWWDKEAGGYRADDTDGDGDKPWCVACQVADWEFGFLEMEGLCPPPSLAQGKFSGNSMARSSSGGPS